MINGLIINRMIPNVAIMTQMSFIASKSLMLILILQRVFRSYIKPEEVSDSHHKGIYDEDDTKQYHPCLVYDFITQMN